MDLLDAQQRRTWQRKLSKAWKWEDQSLWVELKFKTFKQNTAFIHRLLALAEEQNHHPEIHTSYTDTSVRLSTHDAGGITEKDIAMAKAINPLIH